MVGGFMICGQDKAARETISQIYEQGRQKSRRREMCAGPKD